MYLNDYDFYKMSNGGSYKDWTRGDWGRDNFSIQKKQNGWENWLWWSDCKNSDYKSRWSDCGDSNNENIPQSNRMVGSVLKRGPSRRAYQICILETRYPCKEPEDSAEPKKPSSREYENYASKPPRPFHGDKPFADACRTTKKEEHCTKRVCRNHRRSSNDAISCRVFQALGDDLIVEWLTPEELHNTEIAFECKFDWGRVWHGGKVKDKKTAARIHHDLQRGLHIKFVLEKYDRDLAFSAFWYVLDMKDLVQVAYQYSHYKTIRKLSYFN